jgi:hypothetical protein
MSFLLAFTLATTVTGLNGTWERDPDRSDDPRQKMQEAMEQMRGRRGGGRDGGMPPGGGMPGGGMPGGRPGRPPGGKGGPGRGGGPMGAIGTVADTLAIEQDAGELHVDDGTRVRIYYLDGKKHKRELDNGTSLETTASLAGNAVSIEEKMERGEISHKYELSPDGQTLIVTRTLDFGKDPIVIKSVYDRAPGDGP